MTRFVNSRNLIFKRPLKFLKRNLIHLKKILKHLSVMHFGQRIGLPTLYLRVFIMGLHGLSGKMNIRIGQKIVILIWMIIKMRFFILNFYSLFFINNWMKFKCMRTQEILKSWEICHSMQIQIVRMYGATVKLSYWMKKENQNIFRVVHQIILVKLDNVGECQFMILMRRKKMDIFSGVIV